jgi:hypothetical protein
MRATYRRKRLIHCRSMRVIAVQVSSIIKPLSQSTLES